MEGRELVGWLMPAEEVVAGLVGGRPPPGGVVAELVVVGAEGVVLPMPFPLPLPPPELPPLVDGPFVCVAIDVDIDAGVLDTGG